LKISRSTEKNIPVTEHQLFYNKNHKRELILKKRSSWLRKKTNPLAKPERTPSEKRAKAKRRVRS